MSTGHDSAAAPPEAMHTRYGPLFRWLFARFFGPVRFPAEAEDRLAELARKGTLIYVMRSAGILNFLYFNWAFARRGLPLAKAVLGLGTFLYRPLNLAAQRSSSRSVDAVVQAARAGHASMIFLRRPLLLRSKGASVADAFEKLVALQRETDRPIYLVPQLLIFKRAPSRLRPGVTDVVLGSAEVPGRIHAFTSFLFNYKRSFVKVGLPIDLSQLVQDNPNRPDAIVARLARGALSVGLERELHSVVGPKIKSQQRLIEETMRDRLLRAELAKEAEEKRRRPEAVEQEALRALREISARVSPAWIDGANTVARWVFNRIYDGIEVDEEGLQVAAEASKRAPLVICPTHRSHIDYILISHVLVERGITPPLVAAGANLSFWPLGPMFRRMGAFFIRRSFKGDRVYSAALSAYVRKLARDGYTQEFYPEGGRTRTGRILQPKYGLVSIEVDAWIAGARDDLCFVPVAIDYAKVVEARAYAAELAGGEKRREDLRGLLKAPAVLRSRWGRVHVQIDRPLFLSEFAASRGFDPANHTEEERKDLVFALAHRIAYGMGRVQTITASALVAAAALASPERSVSAHELRGRIEILRRLATAKGSRFSLPLQASGKRAARHAPKEDARETTTAREAGADEELLDETATSQARKAIREAMEGFIEDGQVERRLLDGGPRYRVKRGARPTLDFYKNNIAHHFEEESILAAALWALGGQASWEALIERAQWLSRLLKRELSFQPHVSIEETVRATAERLRAHGLLELDEGGVKSAPAGDEPLGFLQGLIGDVVEAYHVAALALDELEDGSLDRRHLIECCFDHGKEALGAGRIRFEEALSKPTFERALGWLLDAGLILTDGERRLALAGEMQSRAARIAFADEIASFLRRD